MAQSLTKPNSESTAQLNKIAFPNEMVCQYYQSNIFIFPFGGHAIGLQGNPGSTKLWKELCEMWLTEKGFLPKMNAAK